MLRVKSEFAGRGVSDEPTDAVCEILVMALERVSQVPALVAFVALVVLFDVATLEVKVPGVQMMLWELRQLQTPHQTQWSGISRGRSWAPWAECQLTVSRPEFPFGSTAKCCANVLRAYSERFDFNCFFNFILEINVQKL